MELLNFYEVQDRNGEVEWGGSSAREAISWYRRGLNNSIFVSVWNEEDPEEPRLITDKIDVTNLVLATLLSERDKEMDLPKPSKKEWVKW